MMMGKLTRKNAHYLETGLFCGLNRPAGTPCGGELMALDWFPLGVRGEYRYEVFCDKCEAHDPHGLVREDQVIPLARRLFRGWEKEAEVLRA